MRPEKFLNTIYLGDRSCKKIVIDGWNRRVLIQVDTISRIRSSSGKWEYYTDEDIVDGYIVFSEVDSIEIEPKGYLPNDYIEIVDVKRVISDDPKNKTERYLFKVSLGSVDRSAKTHDVIVQIIAERVFLEDPLNLGHKIFE